MRRMLRAAWTHPAAPDPPARVWRDWVLVGALLALAIIESLVRPDVTWRWATLAIGIGVITTLLWRRTHPGLMAGITFGALLVWESVRWFAGVGASDSYALAAMLILLYALVRWGSGAEIIVAGAVVLASIVRTFLASPRDLQETVGGIAVVAICATLGAVFRTRESARLQRLERMRLDERERLARDLHDTVAHHVTAIAVRAQAGILTARTDPHAADEALRVIEDEAGQTLREMRSMVQVLRDNQPAPRTPTPTLTDLDALIAGTEGPRATVTVSGDLGAVPESVSASAYRIVQESVTNARRHAKGATSIEVTVTAGADKVGIRVVDDGGNAVALRADQGFGIRGMVERAALLGGTCTAGPREEGGWAVEAELPFPKAAS